MNSRTIQKLAISVCAIGASTVFGADVLISDFSQVNPLTITYVTWATPVPQIRNFTDGGRSGQEVTPIDGGHPVLSGGAANLNCNLDLSGAVDFKLTFRYLPYAPGSWHEAAPMPFTLIDADGTALQWSLYFPDARFQSTDWQTISTFLGFGASTETQAGTVPGLDYASIRGFGLGQIPFSTIGGSAMVRIQFDEMVAVVPEPSVTSLLSIALPLLLLIRWLKKPDRAVAA